MRVLVSGIGRSATTMIYQQVAQMAAANFECVKYSYEPYLWRMNTPKARGSKFGMQDLSSQGMHVHQQTPLFLNNSHSDHDAFVKEIYTPGSREGDPSNPVAYVAKVIRGSGRLSSYLKLFPDLKIILCTRNPIETLNSSFGFFSLLGEEFHVSDRKRLSEEIQLHWPDRFKLSVESDSHLTFARAWWRTFTEWSLRVASEFPDNVFVMPAERFGVDPDAEKRRLIEFLGFGSMTFFNAGLKENAGKKIHSRFLLNSDLAEIAEDFEYYRNEVLAPRIESSDIIEEISASILKKYSTAEFKQPIAGSVLGQKTPIQLRDILYDGKTPSELFISPRRNHKTRISMYDLGVDLLKEGVADYAADRHFCSAPSIIRLGRPTVGCCVTAYNCGRTLRDTVYSLLDQTRPFDEIIIVDDASSDKTPELVADLCSRYQNVRAIFKRENSQVSAARNTGIKALNTTHITHIDGDDCFWPTKNDAEYQVIVDNPSAVAFSLPVRYFKNGAHLIADNSYYSGEPAIVHDMLLRRLDGIPRDMMFSKKAYERAGGFDPRLRLYEDWDFKLRLTGGADAGPWQKADGFAGTIYNKKAPGLSNDTMMRHWRRLTQIFIIYATQGEIVHRNISDAYRDAVRPFSVPHTEYMIAIFNALVAGYIGSDCLVRLIDRHAWVCPPNIFGQLMLSVLTSNGIIVDGLPNRDEVQVTNANVYGFSKTNNFEQVQIKISSFAHGSARVHDKIIQLQRINGKFFFKFRRRNLPFIVNDHLRIPHSTDETGMVLLVPLKWAPSGAKRNSAAVKFIEYVQDIVKSPSEAIFNTAADRAFLLRASAHMH